MGMDAAPSTYGPSRPTRPVVAVPRRKRAFDLAFVILTSVAWLPAVASCAAGILLREGRPVLYRSRRRVGPAGTRPVAKFRTMRRDAERLANRATIPVEGERFLNIPADSPLYTRTGRLVERLGLTELPQLWSVLRGEMTVVGNRPLPEDVVASLREAHPDMVEARFLIPGGLTGPVQLIGRHLLSDAERLALEAAYVDAVADGYTVRLDLALIWRTVWVTLDPDGRVGPAEAHRLIVRHRRRRRAW